MFNNIVNVGKDLAGKLSNKFLNLSDVEIKIKDATNDDAWGPSGTSMKEIAAETYSTMNFNDIMTYLWYRIFMEKPVNSRRTYKGLVVLQYLIINGSDYVAVSCREHIYDLRRLERYVDQNGITDQNIRKKSVDIVAILADPEKLSSERERAKCSQSRFYGSGKTAVQSSSIQQMGNFDDWNPDKNNLPFTMIAEGFAELMDNFSKNINGPPPTETHDNFDIPENDVDFSRQVDRNETYQDRSNYSMHNQFNKPNNQLHNRTTDANTTNNVSSVSDNKTKYVPPIPIPAINGPSRQTSANTSIPNKQSHPIIDFTESIPASDNNNQLWDFFEAKPDNRTTNTNANGEFTSFVGWDNKTDNVQPVQQPNTQPDLLMSTYNRAPIQSVSSATSSTNNETWPGVTSEPAIDFDLLAQSRAIPKQTSGPVLNRQPPIMQPALFHTNPANNVIFTNSNVSNSNNNNNNNKENQSVNDNATKSKTWVGMDLNSLGIDLDNLCNSNNASNKVLGKPVTTNNNSLMNGRSVNKSNTNTKNWGFYG